MKHKPETAFAHIKSDLWALIRLSCQKNKIRNKKEIIMNRKLLICISAINVMGLYRPRTGATWSDTL